MTDPGHRFLSLSRVARGLAVGLWAALASAPGLWAAGDPEGFAPALEALERAAGEKAAVTRSPRTGFATFLALRRGASVPVTRPGAATGAAAAAAPEDRALAFMSSYGRLFGLRDATQLVAVRTSPRDSAGMDHVRLRQVEGGVPVTGAEMLVHLRGSLVVAVNGKALDLPANFDLAPRVGAQRARDAATSLLTRRRKITDATLSEPRLEVFDLGLIGGPPRPSRLAWFVEATRIDLREFIWVDARSGGVLKHFSQLTDAKSRKIYNAHSGPTLPGTLVRSEGGAATGDNDADKAYDYSGDVWDYYKTYHNRDSYDGAGALIKSTVHSCPSGQPCPYPNAFWNGSQMVYGEGLPAADDVDAHELTHAVTERTAGLFYYMQSGALNESFSDIFGETVDLTNGGGDDTPAARWYIGEDIPTQIGSILDYRFAIRNMMDPTKYGDPGKISDSQFRCDDEGLYVDRGGVHTNSGIGNHAYALMVDGGTYNGQTVTGIGLAKAGAIEYRTLTQYLTPASDFLDDYDALNQSCSDLVGIDVGPIGTPAIITSGDCTQVQKALDAVEMANTWPCAPTQASIPNRCPAGTGEVFVFGDNLENTKSGKWTNTVLTGLNAWNGGAGTPPVYYSDFPFSGTYSFWGFDYDTISDSAVGMSKNVLIPTGGRLQFSHSYGFENDATPAYFDGGVIEYTEDNGASWFDAGGLISAGASYGGQMESFGNPLGGRSGFVGESWGYTATQLDLSSLAGKNVRFRFRMGTDVDIADYGWFIDDVGIYSCDVGGSVKLEAPTYTVSEAGPVATIKATRSGGLAGGVTVDYTTSDGSATAGQDYTFSQGMLEFDPSVTTQTFTVPITNDTLAEGNQDFVVTISNVQGPSATLGAPTSAVVTITDNDVAGTVQFSGAAYSFAESAPFATITVKRSGGAASGVSVHYATTNGSAQAGSDYMTASGDLTFGVGATTLTFQVPLINDTIDEANETVNLTLSAPGGGGTLGALSTAVLTILDNDVPGTVQFSGAAYPVSEGAGTAVITVKRSGGAASGVTVNYATADGTATAGSDYTAAVGGVLTFGVGEMTKTFLVPITQDTIGENNETVLLSLSAPTGGATLGPRSTAVMTILEDETVLQFSAPQYPIGEAAPKVTIIVKRSGIVTGPSTVTYDVVQGTALAGSDYTPIASGTLDFAAKATIKTFTIPILNDTVSEPNEFFLVRLSSPVGGVLGPQDTATVLITDDDSVLSFGSATYPGKEGGADVVVTVKRAGNKTTQAVVHYATTDGTATAPDDYTTNFGDLTFIPGAVSQTFKVHVVDDLDPEPTETVTLTLTPVSGALIGLGSSVLSITDNEPVLSLSSATYPVSEAVPTGLANITVKRSGPTTSQATVHYATTDGTATAGSDYTPANGDLTFAPGDVMKTFPILISNDTTGEGPETVNIALSLETGASVGLRNAVLTITDNDASISFGAAAYPVKESGKVATITVKRTGIITAPATVDYATSPGSATAGSDYTTASGTLSFAAGKGSLTFTVPILADAQREGNETVLLTLSNPTGGVIGLGSSVLTILDDDASSVVQFAAASFSGSDAGVGAATILVTRTGGAQGVVSVHYATSDDTATAGADYTTTTGTLTFAAGETLKTFAIPILAGAAEPARNLVVTLDPPGGGATLGRSTAVVFVTD